MKIPFIGRAQEQKTYKIKTGGYGDFSADLNNAKKEHMERELKKKLEKINRLGDQIKDKPSMQKINEYKEQIREYLAYVLKHYYKLTQNIGTYSAQILMRVEVINKKIEELTAEFVKQQRDNLLLVDRIDEIQGLLLDLYR